MIQNIPIWVINLKRSVERRLHIENQLNALGLDFEIIEAIDGRSLPEEALAAVYSSDEARRSMGRELTPGEIGAALSHLCLYQRQVELNVPEVVILEDDVILAPEFLDVLQRFGELPEDCEMLYFYRGDSLFSFWKHRPLGPRHQCMKFASLAFGSCAYLSRRSGAQKLLEHGYPIRMPPDHLTGGRLRIGLRLYGLHPPCVLHLSDDIAHSTMPEAHLTRPRWPTRQELGWPLWSLHKLKWNLIHVYRRLNPLCIV